MRNDLIQSAAPEEAEFAAKKAELEKLSQVLAEKQLDLEELKLAVGRFQHRYFSEIGRKYVELDELRARIAELKTRKHPSDQALHHAAEMAHKQARQTAEEYQGMVNEPEPAPQEFGESEEVKKLYRRIASVMS